MKKKTKARQRKAGFINLSPRDVGFILESLDKPAQEPTEAMKRAIERHKQGFGAK